jgi:hypothetical protein
MDELSSPRATLWLPAAAGPLLLVIAVQVASAYVVIGVPDVGAARVLLTGTLPSMARRVAAAARAVGTLVAFTAAQVAALTRTVSAVQSAGRSVVWSVTAVAIGLLLLGGSLRDARAQLAPERRVEPYDGVVSSDEARRDAGSEYRRDLGGCLLASCGWLPFALAAGLLSDRLHAPPVVALVLIVGALSAPYLLAHRIQQEPTRRRAVLAGALAELRLQRQVSADPSAAEAARVRASLAVSQSVADLGRAGVPIAQIPGDDLAAIDSEIERLSVRLAYERGAGDRQAWRLFVWSLVIGAAISVGLVLVPPDTDLVLRYAPGSWLSLPSRWAG